MLSQSALSQSVLALAGNSVALDRIVLSVSGASPPAKPRLRFDKGVFSVMKHLRAGLTDLIVEGEVVMVTVTAPIWLPGKTASDVEEKARALLVRRSARRELVYTVHGNQIRIRVLKGGPAGAARFVGFVHNPDSDPTPLFEVAQALLNGVAKLPARKRARSAVNHWLVLVDRKGLVHPDVCRHVYPALALPVDFKKVLLVSEGFETVIDPVSS